MAKREYTIKPQRNTERKQQISHKSIFCDERERNTLWTNDRTEKPANGDSLRNSDFLEPKETVLPILARILDSVITDGIRNLTIFLTITLEWRDTMDKRAATLERFLNIFLSLYSA